MDIDRAIEKLRGLKPLPEGELKQLCRLAIEVLVTESNVHPVQSPVCVAGDVHGQFHDLVELFRLGGPLPETKYLFLGDYIDRGFNSVETLQLLLCYKVKWPDRVLLLRGNHESRQINMCYGFHEESLRKYGNPNPWKYCNEVFDFLPLAALVDGRTFCVHGGLSPELKTVDQVRLVDRRQQIPHTGPFADLMWSDPDNIEGWAENERGAGWLFGRKPVADFCRINGLGLVVRAHQLVNAGYQYWFQERNLVTVWSAPNYCYKCGNDASLMRLQFGKEPQFTIFKAVAESGKSLNYKNIIPYFL